MKSSTVGSYTSQNPKVDLHHAIEKEVITRGSDDEFILYIADIHLAAMRRAGAGTKPCTGVHSLERIQIV